MSETFPRWASQTCNVHGGWWWMFSIVFDQSCLSRARRGFSASILPMQFFWDRFRWVNSQSVHTQVAITLLLVLHIYLPSGHSTQLRNHHPITKRWIISGWPKFSSIRHARRALASCRCGAPCRARRRFRCLVSARPGEGTKKSYGAWGIPIGWMVFHGKTC